MATLSFHHLYNEKRTAHAAAFLLYQAGGSLPTLKLLKLLYLAERASLQRFGEPIAGDRLVSMDQGPVMSLTYEHINGSRASVEGGWETWISERANHKVALQNPDSIKDPQTDLLELSRNDLEVLGDVWHQFGAFDRWALVEYTHKHCPEWQDPDGSMIPIDHKVLFAVLGYDVDQSQALIEHLSEQSSLNRVFS